MFAKEVMQTKVISVLSDTPVKEVAKLMLAHDISGLPVVDGAGNVVGVVSELDLMRKQIAPNEPSIWTTIFGGNSAEQAGKYQEARRKYLGKTAGEVMTSPALTVDVSDDLEKAGKLMFSKQVKRVFVTETGKLAGVVSRSAFTRLLVAQDEEAK